MTADALTASSAASERKHALVGVAAALTTVVIWALWIVGTRHAVTTTLDPAAVGILRFAVPALVLAPVWWRAGFLPKNIPVWRMLGLLGSGAPFFLVVATGAQYAPAAEIGPLLPGTMPLFVALIAVTVFGERMDRWRTLGFALILIGIVAIAARGLLDFSGGAWRGHFLLLLGASMWAVYTHAFRRSGWTALEATALVSLWSVLMLLPIGSASLVAAIEHGLTGPFFMQIMLQGVLTGVIGTILYSVSVQRLGAARAAAFAPLGPVMAMLIAVPALGEIPDLAALLGIGATTVGVLLASGVRLPIASRRS